MKHQRLAHVVVGRLSIGAGVAIAGLPNNVPVDATIIPPTTTGAPEPTTTTVPATTAPETTTPDTTEPDTTEPDTTDTTEPDMTDPVPAELGKRSEIVVSVVNGANVAGTALQVASELEDLGDVDVLPLNGTDIEELTTVYFEEAALRTADDLNLQPDSVAPTEDTPSVADLPADIGVLVDIGRDCA